MAGQAAPFLLGYTSWLEDITMLKLASCQDKPRPTKRYGDRFVYFARFIGQRLKILFFEAFPMPNPPGAPQPTPPLAKSAALMEGAVLREETEAVAKKTA